MPKILTDNEIISFRNRLCDLALEAFANHGVEGITLRGLASSVGCSRTTPYRYFKNKADILAALRQREFERMSEALEAAAQREPRPDRQLAALASTYLQFALQHPDAYRVMYEVDQQDTHHYPQLLAQIQRSGAPIRNIVSAAVKSGSMHGDPVNIAHMLWAGLHGLISLHLSHMLSEERDIEELAQVTIRSLARAVASKPTAAPAARRVRPSTV
ncbi:MAG: TetR/AcrR family transcriptional regulator [Halioglobus sp.]